ncbi:MAG: TlpA family protein disulfide reductase [bacterium]|nr:TlpA family protein disulfide reductase [bacterium]
MKELADEPFALIGVNSDDDREELKQVLKDENITWRSFWNGGSTGGPISTAWNVSGWPTIYVLDHEGKIRHKNLRGEPLEKAIKDLIAEQKKSAGEKGE